MASGVYQWIHVSSKVMKRCRYSFRLRSNSVKHCSEVEHVLWKQKKDNRITDRYYSLFIICGLYCYKQIPSFMWYIGLYGNLVWWIKFQQNWWLYYNQIYVTGKDPDLYSINSTALHKRFLKLFTTTTTSDIIAKIDTRMLIPNVFYTLPYSSSASISLLSIIKYSLVLGTPWWNTY